MSNDVKRVWADGFGIWHAAVLPAHFNSRPREQARQAIIAELALREGPNFDPDSVQVERTGGGNGWVFYAEVTS